MADEQALVETTTPEIQEQTPETTQTGSEAEPTPSEPSGRGDTYEALKQAREEIRQLKAGISDPQFIYEQARTLGLTDEEAREQAGQPSTSQPQVSVDQQVEFVLSKRESLTKYPQLAEDEDDQVAVTALMNRYKITPMAAADRYYAKQGKVVEAAKVEGARLKEATISEKEKAQTVTSTTTTSSESTEYEDILRRTRDQTNPKSAEKAQLELIQWKEAHR